MLAGKSAIVTGSTSGIGRGIAESLCLSGCNVMINGFADQAEIEKELKEFEAEGTGIMRYHGADVTKSDELKDMVGAAEDAFGAVDIIVNNAGIQHVDLVEDFPPEKWDAILSLNLSSVFHLSRLVLPGMKQRNWGRIINIASTHGLVASAKKSAYVAAKHGVVGLTKVLALETADTGVTCNAICPGWVLTPLVAKQVEAIAKDKSVSFDEAKDILIGEKHPSREFVTVEELGALAVHLCSDLSASMRGAIIPMDRGWVSQ